MMTYIVSSGYEMCITAFYLSVVYIYIKTIISRYHGAKPKPLHCVNNMVFIICDENYLLKIISETGVPLQIPELQCNYD